MLVSFSGLPATGKTTIARALADALNTAPNDAAAVHGPAVHLRIDTIEQASVDAGAQTYPVGPIGYYVARAIAADHLRRGLIVIADCVNPVTITRDMWRDVAHQAQTPLLEVEISCSDQARHRMRVETREGDIPGLPLPTWQQLQGVDYEPWTREHLSIDTARTSADDAVHSLLTAVQLLNVAK